MGKYDLVVVKPINFDIKAWERATLEGIKIALYRAVLETSRAIYKRSQELVPVDTGALKNSGRINSLTVEDFLVMMEVRYSTPYAGYVHEIPYNHFNPEGATWKYLEYAVDEVRQRLPEIIREAMERGHVAEKW